MFKKIISLSFMFGAFIMFSPAFVRAGVNTSAAVVFPCTIEKSDGTIIPGTWINGVCQPNPSVAFASATVKPVGFFEKLQELLTFNKEKKAQLLQDFSSRSFALAIAKWNAGGTVEAEKLLKQSQKSEDKAHNVASEIADEVKKKEFIDSISASISNRTAVLTAVQAKIENPVAKAAIGNALLKQDEVRATIDAKLELLKEQRESDEKGGGTSTGATGNKPGSSVSNASCTPTTAPYVKVIAPNGGETYYANSAIPLEWKSCNIPGNSHLTGEFVNVNNASAGYALFCEGGTLTWGPECLNDGQQMATPHSLNLWEAGSYKFKITTREGVTVSDSSDAIFKVLAGNAPDNRPHESGNDVNGQHIGYIKSVSANDADIDGGNSLQIDYIQWILCYSGDDCMNGFKIVNINPELRGFQVSHDVAITTANQDSSGNPIPMTLVEFQAFINHAESIGANYVPYWITLNNSVITSITFQYVP